MASYLLIEGGKVANRIEVNPQDFPKWTLIPDVVGVEIGDLWDGVSFSKPAPDIEALAQAVREERNRLLTECDWTQLPDAPVDSAAWAVYRQALRDVSKQEGFPLNVIWPVV